MQRGDGSQCYNKRASSADLTEFLCLLRFGRWLGYRRVFIRHRYSVIIWLLLR